VAAVAALTGPGARKDAGPGWAGGWPKPEAAGLAGFAGFLPSGVRTPGLELGDFLRPALPARGVSAAAAAAAADPKMKLKPWGGAAWVAGGAEAGADAGAAPEVLGRLPRSSCCRKASAMLWPVASDRLLPPCPALSSMRERRSAATTAGPGVGACADAGGAGAEVGVAEPGASGLAAAPNTVEASAAEEPG
jgi:hypothetical protein